MIPRNAVVSIARPSWNQAVMELRRDGVHCEIAIMRSLSDRRKMRVPYATEDRDWGSGVRDHANDSKVRTGRCAGWC